MAACVSAAVSAITAGGDAGRYDPVDSLAPKTAIGVRGQRRAQGSIRQHWRMRAKENVSVQALLDKVQTFLRSEDGPAGTEYGILIALLLLSVFATMGSFGDRVWHIYSAIDGALAASAS